MDQVQHVGPTSMSAYDIKIYCTDHCLVDPPLVCSKHCNPIPTCLLLSAGSTHRLHLPVAVSLWPQLTSSNAALNCSWPYFAACWKWSCVQTCRMVEANAR
jgi:hypothetical protein